MREEGIQETRYEEERKTFDDVDNMEEGKNKRRGEYERQWRESVQLSE